MASTGAPKREYLPRARVKHRRWRIWQSVWKIVNFVVGGVAGTLSAVVAANAKIEFFDSTWIMGFAGLAALLAFVQTAYQPAAQGAGCEIAARVLEKAIERYNADPAKDDIFLVDAVERGIDLLGQAKSS